MMRSPPSWASPIPRCAGTGGSPRAGFIAGSVAPSRERSMAEAERFRRLRAIFDVVAETPPGERQRALEELCRGEPDLQSEAEALLAAEADASAFLADL